MVQIPRKQRLSYILARIIELDLASPTTDISKKLKRSAGNISMMLRNEKEISENFWNLFLENFGELKGEFIEKLVNKENIDGSFGEIDQKHIEKENFLQSEKSPNKKNISISDLLTRETEIREMNNRLLGNNEKLIDSNKVIADSNLNISETGKNISESNKMLASGYVELIDLFKSQLKINSDFAKGKYEDGDEINQALELIARGGIGAGFWQSRDEGLYILSKWTSGEPVLKEGLGM